MKRILFALALVACSASSAIAPATDPAAPSDISGPYTDSLDTNVQIFVVSADSVRLQGTITQGPVVTFFTATLGRRPGLTRYAGTSSDSGLVLISVSQGDHVVNYPLWMERYAPTGGRHLTYNRALYRVTP